MNVELLIDSIVRQTTVLIAQLATSGGLRAPLAHVAGQVFQDLSRELETQGVPTKVRADMFGMALRTYQRRAQRLRPSGTFTGRSLWRAVQEHLMESGAVSREELFRRFRYDDEASLRGVLRDLTESGLVFTSGTGKGTLYRAATSDEVGRIQRDGDAATTDALVWTILYREGPATLEDLASECRLPLGTLGPILDGLIASGRAERLESGRVTVYRSRELVLGFGDPSGWEGAVLDHFSAFVQTITRKLARDQRAYLPDEVGGSTYHFILHRGHPLEDEVMGELRRFRERMSALRDRVDALNRARPDPPSRIQVVAYYGQSFVEVEEDSRT